MQGVPPEALRAVVGLDARVRVRRSGVRRDEQARPARDQRRARRRSASTATRRWRSQLGLTNGADFDPAALPPAATRHHLLLLPQRRDGHEHATTTASCSRTIRRCAAASQDPVEHAGAPLEVRQADGLRREPVGDVRLVPRRRPARHGAGVELERTFAGVAGRRSSATHDAGAPPDVRRLPHDRSSTDVDRRRAGPRREVADVRLPRAQWPAIDQALTPFPETAEQAAADPARSSIRRSRSSARRRSRRTGRPAASASIRPASSTVRVDSIGVGHTFPSGAAQDRRAWLEVIAYDATDNAIVFQSGVVPDGMDPEQIDDPNLFGLWDRTFKADGTPAHFFWDVARVDSKLLQRRRPRSTRTRRGFDHSTTVTSTSARLQARSIASTARVRIRPLPYAMLDEPDRVGRSRRPTIRGQREDARDRRADAHVARRRRARSPACGHELQPAPSRQLGMQNRNTTRVAVGAAAPRSSSPTRPASTGSPASSSYCPASASGVIVTDLAGAVLVRRHERRHRHRRAARPARPRAGHRADLHDPGVVAARRRRRVARHAA